jgi:anti-sigma B factor antagonist
LTELDEVIVTRVENAIVISLRGEHDLATTPRIQEAYDAARGDQRIVFDLTEATFIDSSVIGILLGAARQGAPVAVVAPTGGPPARLIAVLGVDGVVSAYETRDDALRATSGSG